MGPAAQETAGEMSTRDEAAADGGRSGGSTADTPSEALEVWIDQDLCTGDGICAQYAPEVFELDIDGLAYVKSSEDELLTDAGATAPVPPVLLADVVASAKDCPGDCIHVRRMSDRVEVHGPDAR